MRILKSATELFCKYSFDRVSISEVMSLARMTHGAFYAHFESKEALFRESLAETFRRCHAKRLAKAPFSLRHLTRLVNHYLNLRTLGDQAEPGPEMILFNEIDADRQEIRSLYQDAYLGMLKILETRMRALGRLHKIEFNNDVGDRARAVLATLVGAVAIAKSIDDEGEQARILLSAQNQILSLIGADADARLYPADASLITAG